MGRETWRAAVHGVTKYQTWLSDWTELNWIYTDFKLANPHNPMRQLLQINLYIYMQMNLNSSLFFWRTFTDASAMRDMNQTQWKHNVGMVEFGEVVKNEFSGENLISTEAWVQGGREAGRGRNGSLPGWRSIGGWAGVGIIMCVWRKLVRTRWDWLDDTDTGEKC